MSLVCHLYARFGCRRCRASGRRQPFCQRRTRTSRRPSLSIERRQWHAERRTHGRGANVGVDLLDRIHQLVSSSSSLTSSTGDNSIPRICEDLSSRRREGCRHVPVFAAGVCSPAGLLPRGDPLSSIFHDSDCSSGAVQVSQVGQSHAITGLLATPMEDALRPAS